MASLFLFNGLRGRSFWRFYVVRTPMETIKTEILAVYFSVRYFMCTCNTCYWRDGYSWSDDGDAWQMLGYKAKDVNPFYDGNGIASNQDT